MAKYRRGESGTPKWREVPDIRRRLRARREHDTMNDRTRNNTFGTERSKCRAAHPVEETGSLVIPSRGSSIQQVALQAFSASTMRRAAGAGNWRVVVQVRSMETRSRTAVGFYGRAGSRLVARLGASLSVWALRREQGGEGIGELTRWPVGKIGETVPA